MGGMIAQLVAIHHPQRAITLISIMSSTGEQDISPPTQEALGVLLKPSPNEREAYIENSVANWRVLSVSQSKQNEVLIRDHAARRFERGIHPPGVARQLAAVLATYGRREALKQINIPTLVIHGDVDPLVPLDGGLDTAHSIPNAEILILEGFGHDMPPEVWPKVVSAIAEHTATASGYRID
jgi:pimeloyl-ACP methyl ester carboxylesterase